MKDFSEEIKLYNDILFFLNEHTFPTAILEYTIPEKADYLTVKLLGNISLRIKVGEKVCYFETHHSCDGGVKQASGWWRYEFTRDGQNAKSNYSALLKSLQKELDKLSSFEVACCHRYLECSDARKCVIPDSDRSNLKLKYTCYYHKNLREGKIFYGKNRNI